MLKQTKRKAKDFIEQLNGSISFIKGNHDQNNSLNTKIISLVVILDNQEIFCVHDPQDYSSSYSLNLVGHVHEKWKIRKIYNTFLVNVGVDVWNFHPINIQEITKALNQFTSSKEVHKMKTLKGRGEKIVSVSTEPK